MSSNAGETRSLSQVANVNPILGAAAGAGAHAPSGSSGARLRFAPAAPCHAAHSLARDGCQGRLRGARSPPPPWARCCSAEMRSCQCPCSGPPLRRRACAPLIPAGWEWYPRAGEGNPTRRSAAPVRRGEGKAKAPSRPGKRPPHQLLCRLVTEWPQLVPSEKPRSTVTKTLGSRGRTGFKPGLSRFLPRGPRGRRATSPGPRFLIWEVWAEGLLCIRITKHY